MSVESGFVDLQVNGYSGVDFNSNHVSVEQFRFACEQLREHGVDGILATIITDDVDLMKKRLANIVSARNADSLIAEVIWGVHIEGPFLNEQPGYIGAHPTEHAKPANRDDMLRLLDAAGGLTKIVTLAPERDPNHDVTRMLSEQGIVVSAGHCNPSIDELDAAIDSGLRMFTHLGNGCPLDQHRHDNIIQRILSRSPDLWIGFIADGVHVPSFALGNYLKCAGFDRSFIVTDAIAAAGKGPGIYELANQTVVVDDNLATWAEDKSHLVGSASTMHHLVSVLSKQIGLTDITIRQLTIDNPKNILLPS